MQSKLDKFIKSLISFDNDYKKDLLKKINNKENLDISDKAYIKFNYETYLRLKKRGKL